MSDSTLIKIWDNIWMCDNPWASLNFVEGNTALLNEVEKQDPREFDSMCRELEMMIFDKEDFNPDTTKNPMIKRISKIKHDIKTMVDPGTAFEYMCDNRSKLKWIEIKRPLDYKIICDMLEEKMEN